MREKLPPPSLQALCGALAAVLVVALATGGCSTGGWPGGTRAWGWNPQNYQGCTVGQFRQHEFAPGAHGRDGGLLGGPETELTVEMLWFDCKDKDRVRASVDAGELGSFDYQAEDVRGLERAAVRAQVEEAANAAGVELGGEAVEAIVEALTTAGGVP